MDVRRLRRLALGTVIAIWRERIRTITHGGRLTQHDLESGAKLPRSSVSRIELGKASPEPDELRRIADFLGTEPEELMSESELMFDLLKSALGPLRTGDRYAPLHSTEDEVAEASAITMSERIRRRWDALLNAERSLAQERALLEYESALEANRTAIAQGPP